MNADGREAPAASRPEDARPRRRPALRLSLSLAGLLVFAGLVALGVWQVERLAWKLDLIARVDARVHAAPVEAPSAAQWPGFDPVAEEYRHVRLTGTFLENRETLVQAVTDLGPGFWVVTPMRRDGGDVVLVNRGFVPADRRDPMTRAEGRPGGPVTLTGLLRPGEPGGGFLRANDPAADRWFSRDVEAIAAARGLGTVAPFFVDADATPNPGGWPAGGLTVIAFRNHHLVYALTWFTLAAMLAGAGGWIASEGWRRRRRQAPGASSQAGAPDLSRSRR